MEVKDKIVFKTHKKLCCPPHYIPHKIPDGKPIKNEPCHTHNKTWRRVHHNIFCKLLKCPNYKFMKKETEKITERKKRKKPQIKWPHPCRHTPARFIEALVLDIKSIPGLFMSDEANAKWHLKHVCPHCSKHRKSFRDIKEKGDMCMWEEMWKQGHYVDYPRNFGIKTWILYYLGIRSNLKRFHSLYEKLTKKKK